MNTDDLEKATVPELLAACSAIAHELAIRMECREMPAWAETFDRVCGDAAVLGRLHWPDGPEAGR